MLPKDPMMLLSVINTKLRDEYDSLFSLCEDMDEDEEEIRKTLKAVGFEYDEDRNCFH